MYWYRFEPAEIQLAERQADAQVHENDAARQTNVSRKTVGNLGEYAVKAFLEDFAHPDRWAYVNEQAHVADEPEYEPYDFALNGTRIDVKTTTNLSKVHPSGIIMAGPDQGYHPIAESDKASIYIFVLLDRNLWPVGETSDAGPTREAALILGWASYADLNREAFVDVGQHSRGQGVYLPFNSIYQLLLRLGCTVPYES